MNGIVWTLYREYLDHVGDKAAAASLALAEVMQQTLDAEPARPPEPAKEIERREAQPC